MFMIKFGNVILSAAKDLTCRTPRSFAALRMTKHYRWCLWIFIMP